MLRSQERVNYYKSKQIYRFFRCMISFNLVRNPKHFPIPEGTLSIQFPSEYRSITFTPVWVRIYEKLYMKISINFKESLYSTQFGWLKGFVTENTLFPLVHDFQTSPNIKLINFRFFWMKKILVRWRLYTVKERGNIFIC